jgi:hypothetical protein
MCLHPDHGDRPATHTIRGTFIPGHGWTTGTVGITVNMCDECYARANGWEWPPGQHLELDRSE